MDRVWKFFYLLVVSLVGSTVALVMYDLPSMFPYWHIAIGLCAIGLLVKAGGWKLPPWQRRYTLGVILVFSPLCTHIGIELFGNANWELHWPITWPRAVHSNGQWLLPYLPNQVQIVQHDIARWTLAEICGWGWAFVVVWKHRH